MKNIVLLFIILTLLGQSLLAQNPTTVRVLPPSPEAASLGKYGEIPVSLHTGVPSITIPIFTLTSQSLSTDISLCYHASGIKVDEIASHVGLGWSLNAGGIITRSVIGHPDDGTDGFLNNDKYHKDFEFMTEVQRHNLWFNVEDMDNSGIRYDVQPDIFYFNFAGKSGKFYIDKRSPNQGNTFMYQGMKIEVLFNSSKYIDKFIITTEDGTKYYFGGINAIESITMENLSAPLDIETFFNQMTSYTSGWLLTKIESANGEDFIEFKYHPYSIMYDSIHNASLVKSTCNTSVKITQMLFNVGEQRIDEIISRSGKVKFIKSTEERLDMKGDYPLKEIKVFNSNNQLIRDFIFEYGYFQEYYTLLNGIPYWNGNEYKRLKLQSVQEILSKQNPYEFLYHSGMLPSRYSTTQDHWGYNNGKISNTNLIPFFLLGSHNTIVGGANRDVNEEAMKIGVLTQIKYPTKGSTKFTYESNDVPCWMISLPVSQPDLELKLSISINSGNYVAVGEFRIDADKVPCNTSGKVLALIEGSGYSTGQNIPLIAELYNIDNPSATTSVDMRYPPHSIFLESGRYSVMFYGGDLALPTPDLYPNANLIIRTPKEFSDPYILNNLKVGGLRISKIENFDDISNSPILVKKYNYKLPEYPDLSSGFNTNSPNYHSNFTQTIQIIGGGIVSCNIDVLSSNSKTPLGHAGGNVVEYKYIEVVEEGNENIGKQTYEYLAQPGHWDIIWTLFPFPPVVDLSWKRGLVKNHKIYKYANNEYKLVRHIENEYEFPEEYDKKYYGLSVGCRVYYTIILNGIATKFCNDLVLTDYQLESGWFYLKNTKEYVYEDEGNDYFSTNNNYHYNIHRQLSQNKVSGNNQTFISKYKYPLDYTYDPNNSDDGCGLETDCFTNLEDDYAAANTWYTQCKDACPETISAIIITYRKTNGNTTSITSNVVGSSSGGQYNVLVPVNDFSAYVSFKVIFNGQHITPPQSSFTASATSGILQVSYNPTNCIQTCNIGRNSWLQQSRDDYQQCLNNIQTCLDDKITNTNLSEAERSLYLMRKKHIISPVIEQTSWVQKGTTPKELLSAQKTDYKIKNGDMVLPSAIKVAELASPIPDNPSGSLNIQSLYQSKIQFTDYDTQGNLLSQKLENDIPTSYLWGYNNQYPIAQVANASESEIAYTSFEESGKGKWTYTGANQPNDSRTGKNHYLLNSGNLSKSGLISSKKYKVSLWVKGSGNVIVNGVSRPSPSTTAWNLLEWEVSNATSITISSTSALKIDEVRLHPSEAMMTTYTFAPLIGMTSQTDPNNQTMYYEYDGFGRLLAIKDFEGNILKTYEYHYKGQD